MKIHYFLKNLLLYSQAQIRQTEGIVIMSKERSTEIVNFMTPRAGILVLGRGKIIHTVKMLYFFTNLLFTQAYIRQTESLVMMTKKESTKIVNFRGSCAGVRSYSKHAIYFSSSCLHQDMDQTHKVYSNNVQGRVCQDC